MHASYKYLSVNLNLLVSACHIQNVIAEIFCGNNISSLPFAQLNATHGEIKYTTQYYWETFNTYDTIQR